MNKILLIISVAILVVLSGTMLVVFALPPSNQNSSYDGYTYTYTLGTYTYTKPQEPDFYRTYAASDSALMSYLTDNIKIQYTGPGTFDYNRDMSVIFSDVVNSQLVHTAAIKLSGYTLTFPAAGIPTSTVSTGYIIASNTQATIRFQPMYKTTVWNYVKNCLILYTRNTQNSMTSLIFSGVTFTLTSSPLNAQNNFVCKFDVTMQVMFTVSEQTMFTIIPPPPPITHVWSDAKILSMLSNHVHYTGDMDHGTWTYFASTYDVAIISSDVIVIQGSSYVHKVRIAFNNLHGYYPNTLAKSGSFSLVSATPVIPFVVSFAMHGYDASGNQNEIYTNNHLHIDYLNSAADVISNVNVLATVSVNNNLNIAMSVQMTISFITSW